MSGPFKWFGLLLLLLGLATALMAEWVGTRLAIYCGALGGMLLGLVGYVVAVRIAGRHGSLRGATDGRWDIWTCWGVGLLARLALLGLLAWVYWWLLPSGLQSALLSLTAVYLVLLFWETAWLYRMLVTPKERTG